MKTKISIVLAIAFFLGAALPASASDISDLEVSGWLPYWQISGATKDARNHIDELSLIYPFGYAVKKNGKLNDLVKISDSSWKKLLKVAREKDVLVVPTIMWTDSSQMHLTLSDPKARKSHIKQIVSLVKKKKFDGVNIDYEGKMAETKDAYSLFLKELKKALPSDAILTCATEARTPPESLYTTVPADLRYANDYVEIAKYCDHVDLMTYDQQRADLTLNGLKTKDGAPYAPVSDVDWVRKVIDFTAPTIPKDQIVLGIPTYGHEYEVIVWPNGYQEYNKIRALNPKNATDLARKKKVTPSRNSAGEMSFTYPVGASKFQLTNGFAIPAATPSGNITAARAAVYAKMTNLPVVFNFVSWSDDTAMKQKVDLAAELGVRGVAFFKIDGTADKDMWDIFK